MSTQIKKLYIKSNQGQIRNIKGFPNLHQTILTNVKVNKLGEMFLIKDTEFDILISLNKIENYVKNGKLEILLADNKPLFTFTRLSKENLDRLLTTKEIDIEIYNKYIEIFKENESESK